MLEMVGEMGLRWEVYAFESGFGSQTGFHIVLAANGRCSHFSQQE